MSVETAGAVDADAERGVVRTSNPERITAVRPKRRAKRTSRSSWPVIDPCGLDESRIRVIICEHVTVVIRESSIKFSNELVKLVPSNIPSRVRFGKGHSVDQDPLLPVADPIRS